MGANGQLQVSMVCGLKSAAKSGLLLFRRELANTNQTSEAGWIWELLTPIAIAGVFILLFKLRAIDVSIANMPYEAFVVSGVLSWQIFNLSFTRGMTALIANKVLNSHIKISPNVFFFNGLFYALWVAGFRVLVVSALFLSIWDISWVGLLGFVGIAALLGVFGFGLGQMLAPIRMIYGDVEPASRIILQVLFYISGTVFPLPGDVEALSIYNPIAVLISSARSMLVGAPLEYPMVTLATAMGIIISLVLSWYVFVVGSRFLRGL